MKFCAYKEIKLGNFTAKQFTLFESKHLFSVIFYWFIGDGWQDRYHDHAFRAISLRLWGSYQERVMYPGGDVEEVPRNTSRWRYFPRRHVATAFFGEFEPFSVGHLLGYAHRHATASSMGHELPRAYSSGIASANGCSGPSDT